MDGLTGQILYEQNAQAQIAPASFVKLLTLYLAFDAIRAGQLKTDDLVTVSEKAWRIDGSKMFIKVGDRVRVEDLLKGIAIASGNDASRRAAWGFTSGPNVLMGDTFFIDPNEAAGNISGDAVVALEFDTRLDWTTEKTFYNRYFTVTDQATTPAAVPAAYRFTGDGREPLGSSYAFLSGDWSDANFGSMRIGRADEQDYWEALQEWFIEEFCVRVFEAWLPRAILAGELEAPNYDLARIGRVEWQGRRWTSPKPLFSACLPLSFTRSNRNNGGAFSHSGFCGCYFSQMHRIS